MPAGRYFPNVAYYAGNGKIYVIGGFGPTPNVEADQTWEYDPVADTWNIHAGFHSCADGSQRH